MPFDSVRFWQVKAAFTRTYNKEAHLTPYAISSGPKKGKRKGGAGGGEGELGEEGEEDTAPVSEESEGEDVMADGMIKVSSSEMKWKLNLEPLNLRRTNKRLTIFHKAINGNFALPIGNLQPVFASHLIPQ